MIILNFLFEKTPLFFMIQSFWRDEAFSYLLAKRSISEIIFLTAKDFNPPLYYLILHFWVNIFGNSEIVLRSLSLIFYWLTIYLLFLFVYKILRIRDRLFISFVLFFLATNPLLIYYAFEARMYTQFAFLSILSYYTFLRGKKTLFIIVSILNLYTHYFSIFIYLSQFIFLVMEKKVKRLKKEIIWFVLPFLFFLPWLILLLIKNVAFFQNFWIKKIEMQKIFFIFSYLYTGFEEEFNFFKKEIKYFGTIFFLLIFYFSVNKREIIFKKKEYFLIFLWGVVLPLFIFLISFFKPMFLPRYLIPLALGVLTYLVLILKLLNKKLAWFILIFLIIFNCHYNLIQVEKRRKKDIRKVVREIKAIADKDDYLYVTNTLDFHTAQYYFNEDRVFIFNQDYKIIPWYVGKVLISKENIKYNLPFYPKKAFILYPDGYYEIKAML